MTHLSVMSAPQASAKTLMQKRQVILRKKQGDEHEIKISKISLSSLPVQVVLVPGHGDHLGYDGLLRPLSPELLHQLLQVVGGGLADRENVVNQPRHAQAATAKIFFKNILM